MPASLAAATVLDREFLEIRAKLIDLAASLDRIQRANATGGADSRIEKIVQAARILADQAPDRAEQIQMLFSLPYDELWRI